MKLINKIKRFFYPKVNRESRTTLSGRAPVNPDNPFAPDVVDPKTGKRKDYWVLSKDERAKGFVRPVRKTYRHTSCDTTTVMALPLAETYARDPKFYGSTFCVHCATHYPVEEFVWNGTEETVGD